MPGDVAGDVAAGDDDDHDYHDDDQDRKISLCLNNLVIELLILEILRITNRFNCYIQLLLSGPFMDCIAVEFG